MTSAIRGGVLAMAIGAPVFLVTPPAQADDTKFEITGTGIGIYPRADTSMSSERVGPALADGEVVTVGCETSGDMVDNGYAPSDVWSQLEDGTYLPNAHILTGFDGRTPGVPGCDDENEDRSDSDEQAAEAPNLDRFRAAMEARHWALSPQFVYPADCTFYVSLALWEGGLAQDADWTQDSPDKSKWGSPWFQPGATIAAVNSQAFVEHMQDAGHASVSPIDWSDNTANGAELADVIAYDWEGDSTIDHLAIVTSINADGYPLVSQHTPAQLDRYWSWSRSKNDWIEHAQPGSRAYLVHFENTR